MGPKSRPNIYVLKVLTHLNISGEGSEFQNITLEMEKKVDWFKTRYHRETTRDKGLGLEF